MPTLVLSADEGPPSRSDPAIIPQLFRGLGPFARALA